MPMLKELIRHAGKSGTREVVLGMAHRGRLNVLVNVLGKTAGPVRRIRGQTQRTPRHR